jgi:cation transporter-like permease
MDGVLSLRSTLMRSLFDSIVRTFTPLIVGNVIGWFVTADIPLDPEFETALTLVIGGAFSALYYVAVRVFEVYVSPKFGWLLGLAKKPVYVASK